jgi:hypothetical protein
MVSFEHPIVMLVVFDPDIDVSCTFFDDIE